MLRTSDMKPDAEHADQQTLWTQAEVSAFYAARVTGLKQQGTDWWRGPCPLHCGKDNNFAVNPINGCWHCFSQCDEGGTVIDLEMKLSNVDRETAFSNVREVIRRSWRRVATYVYRDEHGAPLFRVVRSQLGEGAAYDKRFIQHKFENGKWLKKLGDARRVPYRLNMVVKAKFIFLVEGGKDADTCSNQLGFTASTNPMGARKWRSEYNQFFAKKHVAIIPDNDEPGREHALEVAQQLLGCAASVRIIELSNLPEKGDLTDWVNAGGTSDQIIQLWKKLPRLDQSGLEQLRNRRGLKASGSHEGAAKSAEQTAPGQQDAGRSFYEQANWPEPLAQEAYHGPVGELVRRIEPHSEADPAALLIQALIGTGNVIGRHVHFQAERNSHYTNLFAVIVGQTSKGRKGTALGHVKHTIAQIDPTWSTTRIMGGLARGEGLIWAVRDPIRGSKPTRQQGRIVGHSDVVVDPGVPDKRLLVVEPEFARVLQVVERETNTLSAVIREAWDTGSLRILTKNQSASATGAHISIIGHITKDELLFSLTRTSAANGFANRFLWVCARRSKILPEGGALDTVDFEPTTRKLRDALSFAQDTAEMQLGKRARALWHQVYPELSEGKPGLLGAVTSRAEAQVMRLASLYAVLDCSSFIAIQHLRAALAVWKYCEDSARFIFGDALGNPTADEILRALRRRPGGMTRDDIREHFSRNRSSEEIEKALGTLQHHGLARVQIGESEGKRGRPAERWFAISPTR